MNNKEITARWCAKFLKDGDVVNLGIGIPSLVTQFIPEGVDVWLQVENGAPGVSGTVQPGDLFWDKELTDAGDAHITLKPGGVTMDIVQSFVIIRGHHIDMTILGAFQVDAEGSIANWTVPGQITVGMGGTTDLAVGAKTVVAALEHCDKNRNSKILDRCTLPLTGKGVVSYIVTELCVLHVTEDGLVLEETAPGVTVEDIIAHTDAKLLIPDTVKCME